MMTKQDYLDLLNDYLLLYFSEEDAKEILYDYEEHFYEGMAAGHSQEELIQRLGNPKKLAKTIADELKETNKETTHADDTWAKIRVFGKQAKTKAIHAWDATYDYCKTFYDRTLQNSNGNIVKTLFYSLALLFVSFLLIVVFFTALSIAFSISIALLVTLIATVLFIPLQGFVAGAGFFVSLILFGILLLSVVFIRISYRTIKRNIKIIGLFFNRKERVIHE